MGAKSWIGWGLILVALGAGLWWTLRPDAAAQLVLYCGVDMDQSRPMVDAFADEAGMQVDFHGEVEAFRSIGLAQRLELERDKPRADVWWSNEIMHMVNLAEKDIIAPLPQGIAELFPRSSKIRKSVSSSSVRVHACCL